MKKPAISYLGGRVFLGVDDRARIADAILVRYGAGLEHNDVGKAAAVVAAKELTRGCVWTFEPTAITTTCHGRLPDGDLSAWESLIGDASPDAPEIRYCPFCGGILHTRGLELAGEGDSGVA